MSFITALGRAATRLGKAGALLALTAGLPYALITYVGWPLPHTLPRTGADVQHLLTSPITDTMVIDLLAVALWLLWMVFTASVLAEIIAGLRGVRPLRLRAVAPVQSLAAWLLSGVTAGVVAATALTPAAASLHTAAPAIAVVNLIPAPAAASATQPGAVGHSARTGIVAPATAQLGRPTTGSARHLEPHEPTRDMASAPRFALAAHDGPLAVTAAGKHWTVTVHRGDTLWDLADAWLRDPTRWPEIYHLNTDRYDHNGRMLHGDHIEPGWRLRLPADATPPAGATPADPSSPPTAGANRPRPTQPTASEPGSPTPGAPASNSPTPSPSVTSPVIPSPSVTSPPTLGATAPPAGPAIPATVPPTVGVATSPAPRPTPSATSAPTPRHAASTDSPPASQAAPDYGGVDLGEHGWVALDLAAAIGGAAALLWIHRRRLYRTQPVNRRRRDTDLTALPATIAALHHARTPVEDADMNASRPDLPEAATVTTAALGAHPDHSPLRMHDLPAHGVGLTGAGASAAARGVLAAVLSAGGPWAADGEATIITTRADLVRILDGAPWPALDRLQVVDDVLRDAERQLLYRARAATDDDITTEPTDDPRPRLPAAVILTAPPTGEHANRLAAILTIGARLGITAVLTGPWPHGDTWTVAITGATTRGDHPGPRLNVLGAAATADILDTLRQARPSDPELPPAAPGPRLAATPTAHPAPAPAREPQTPFPSTPDNATSTSPTANGSTPPRARVTAEPSSPRPVPGGPLRLTVLGRPRVDVAGVDGRTELRIRRSDGVQILVHLAVDPDGATSDQLMAALWPEVRPRYARGRFHTTMSELRGVLTEAAGAETILRTGERYRLDSQQMTVDLWDLNDAIERASVALDPAAHADALREIIALHTGTVADGHSWLWLNPYREATRRHILDAYVALAETEPDPPTALVHIQDAISLDPYNEDVYQRAMRLHAQLGSTDGIRRTLRALSERLTELEVRVSPQTQQIATDLINRVDARRRIAGSAA